MELQERQRVLWLVINHLMKRKGAVDFAELNKKLPKDRLEQMTDDEKLDGFVKALGIYDIARQLQADKPMVEHYLWRR